MDEPIANEPTPPPLIVQAASPPTPLAPLPARKDPHPLLAVTLYLFMVFAGAAIVAPRFHASAQFLAENNPAWRSLAEQPFHRYVGRSLLLLALVGLPIFIKALRIPSARSLGLVFGPRHWVEGGHGFIWGFATLAIAAAMAISSGARTWNSDHGTNEVWRHVQTTVVVALVVAMIEELLFRGALFGALRRRYAFWPAAVLSSSFYAILHFFEQPTSPDLVHWYSGFATLGQMLRGFTNWQSLLPGFLNLLLIGLMLSLTLERTESLLYAIGLHAGLIFWVKTLGFSTRGVPDANTWAWGSGKLVDGWASALILLSFFFALRAILPGRQENDS